MWDDGMRMKKWKQVKEGHFARKDIAEIEGKVDKILFEKKKRVSLETKDSVNQKQQSPISNKLKYFDTESFSPEAKYKKPVYFVKVKKDSDGKRKKTVTRKKLKKIFRKNKKETEPENKKKEPLKKTVQKAINKVSKNCTTFIIAHRLPTIQKIEDKKHTVADKKKDEQYISEVSTKDSRQEKTDIEEIKPSSPEKLEEIDKDDTPKENQDKEKTPSPVKKIEIEGIKSVILKKVTGKKLKKIFHKNKKETEPENKKKEPVSLPGHKWHGFPPREENASGVLKKRPYDSSHNINVGDISLGFTLKKTVQKAINKVSKNRTTSIAAHRLSTIQKIEDKKHTVADKKKDEQYISEVSTKDSWQEKTDIEEIKSSSPEKLEEIDKDDTPKENQDKEKTPSPVKKIEIGGITPDGEIQFLNDANQLKSVILKKFGYSKEAWEELDFYPLEEPFAYVEIIREKDTLDKRYVLVEIELSKDEARISKFMKETLSGFSVDTIELESKGEEPYLIKKMDQIIDDYALKSSTPSKKKIVYFLKKQFLGLDRLEVLMKDPNIEDISCDGSSTPIFVYHRRYGSLKSNVQFDNEEELSDFVVKLAQKCGKHISIAEPMLDATMPDGSRLQTTLSTEVTTKGSTFTIRKFKEYPFSPPDLIEFNTMSAEMIAYLWLAVENGINALVAGGTAAGKTSTLNALCLFIPREAKIVSIEETREINLPHPN